MEKVDGNEAVLVGTWERQKLHELKDGNCDGADTSEGSARLYQAWTSDLAVLRYM